MSSTINFTNASYGNKSIMDTVPISRRSFLPKGSYSVSRFPRDSSTTVFTKEWIADEERPDMQSSASSSDTPQDPEIDRSDARAQEGAPPAKKRKIERTCVGCEVTKTVDRWHPKGPGIYQCDACYDKMRYQNHPKEPTERACVKCDITKKNVNWHETPKDSGTYKCHACYEQDRRRKRPREKIERTCVGCEKTKNVIAWQETRKGSGIYRCKACDSKMRYRNHPKEPTERTCVKCEKTKKVVNWHETPQDPGSYKCHACYEQARRNRSS